MNDKVILFDVRNPLIGAQASDNSTALHYAAAKGHVSVVAHLLDKEASMTVENEDGDKPVHAACRSGNTEYVHLSITNT